MNPFVLSFEERLKAWKDLRKSLPDMADDKKLEVVAQFWSNAPIVSTSMYDLEDCDTWVTPWEFIKNNQWCRSSVAISMENTLRLSGFDSERLRLKLILDRDISEILMFLIVDDKFVLNYDWGRVRDYPKTNHYVIKKWKFVGKSYKII